MTADVCENCGHFEEQHEGFEGCWVMNDYEGSCLGPDDVCECARYEPHPCGHEIMQTGCGGCDPGAIEFEIPDWQTHLLARANRRLNGSTS